MSIVTDENKTMEPITQTTTITTTSPNTTTKITRSSRSEISEKMREIYLLENLDKKLNSHRSIWKSNLKAALAVLNLSQFRPWQNTTKFEYAPTDSWSEYKILSSLVQNFNIRIVNLYHYCKERSLPMVELELEKMLMNASTSSKRRTWEEDKLSNAQDVLNYCYCLRKEMGQLSKDIEIRIPDIQDEERIQLRKDLCVFWDTCLGFNTASLSKTNVSETGTKTPMQWKLSELRIASYLSKRPCFTPSSSSSSFKTSLSRILEASSKLPPSSSDVPLYVSDTERGDSFILHATFRTLSYVRVFMFSQLPSHKDSSLFSSTTTRTTTTTTTTPNYRSSLSPNTIGISRPRQLILTFRPFDFPEDQNSLPVEQCKKLVSNLCMYQSSDMVFPSVAQDSLDLRFRRDSIRIPMTMQNNIPELERKPYATQWIRYQKYLNDRNSNVGIHPGFWQTAVQIIKDYRFRSSLENCLLETNPITGKLNWKVDEIFITGYSLGAGLGHIIAYLLRVFYLPFYARLVETECVNHYGLRRLELPLTMMPKIKTITMGAPRVGNDSFCRIFTQMNTLDHSMSVINFVTVKDEPVAGVVVDPIATFPPNRVNDIDVMDLDHQFCNLPYIVFIGRSPSGQASRSEYASTFDLRSFSSRSGAIFAKIQSKNNNLLSSENYAFECNTVLPGIMWKYYTPCYESDVASTDDKTAGTVTSKNTPRSKLFPKTENQQSQSFLKKRTFKTTKTFNCEYCSGTLQTICQSMQNKMEPTTLRRSWMLHNYCLYYQLLQQWMKNS